MSGIKPAWIVTFHLTLVLWGWFQPMFFPLHIDLLPNLIKLFRLNTLSWMLFIDLEIKPTSQKHLNGIPSSPCLGVKRSCVLCTGTKKCNNNIWVCVMIFKTPPLLQALIWICACYFYCHSPPKTLCGELCWNFCTIATPALHCLVQAQPKQRRTQDSSVLTANVPFARAVVTHKAPSIFSR